MIYSPWDVLLILNFLTTVSAVDPLVSLQYSTYRGVPLQNGITQWLGMRYAAPPLGNLRFAEPADPLPTNVTQAANKQGPVCLASPANTDNTTSEDCLFIGVYAPTRATTDSKLPVYVFIQGGGYNSNANSNYNGSGLIQAAEYDMIVVTFNYRVGLYGFLGGQKLLGGGGSYNNGLKDQRKALEWVQKYITQFGGDPGHVVLGGESSITYLLTAYGGRNDNLFHATAGESQSFGPVSSVVNAQYQYNGLVARTRCNRLTNSTVILACLRSLSVAEIQRANVDLVPPGTLEAPVYVYSPVIDGDMITNTTYGAFSQGHYIRLPAIYGSDTNEGTIFVPPSISSVRDAQDFIQHQWPTIQGQDLDTIARMYLSDWEPNVTFPDSGRYWRKTANAYGDLRYVCPQIFIAAGYTAPPTYFPGGQFTAWNPQAGLVDDSLTAVRRQYVPSSYVLSSTASSTPPVWLYRYNVLDPTQAAQGYGVPHAVEATAKFGPQYVGGAAPLSYNTTNAWIVPVMQGYWTSFIRFYDPNIARARGTPFWERYVWGDDNNAEGNGARLRFGSLAGGEGVAMEGVPLSQMYRCEWLWSIAHLLTQ